MTRADNIKRLDYVRIERALMGNLPPESLTPEEHSIFQAEKAAFDIGKMAERFAQGYYAHTAAIKVARDPGSKSLLTAIQPNQPVPSETIIRRNGTNHVFDSHYYLEYLNTPEMVNDLDKVWLVGSLLTISDALKKHDYFQHLKRPELELLYHLRNGIAHGNHFNIDKRGKDRLTNNPAHNKMARVKVRNAEFEITPYLHKRQVLFDFMGPGDILDLLQSVGIYLTQLRERVGKQIR